MPAASSVRGGIAAPERPSSARIPVRIFPVTACTSPAGLVASPVPHICRLGCPSLSTDSRCGLLSDHTSQSQAFDLCAVPSITTGSPQLELEAPWRSSISSRSGRPRGNASCLRRSNCPGHGAVRWGGGAEQPLAGLRCISACCMLHPCFASCRVLRCADSVLHALHMHC